MKSIKMQRVNDSSQMQKGCNRALLIGDNEKGIKRFNDDRLI